MGEKEMEMRARKTDISTVIKKSFYKTKNDRNWTNENGMLHLAEFLHLEAN